MDAYDVLIVGAGHAGAQTAASLRQLKFAGRIGLLGDEPHLPYERPPLSKDYLAGEKSFDAMLLRSEAYWRERDIDLLLGRKIVSVRPEAHEVTTASGEIFGYRSLVWAAGGSPRRLNCEGGDLRGVHVLRARADADRMVGDLARTERVIVIGAGYIGLESAAVLTKLGKQVTVLEAQPRVLARVAGPLLASFYAAEHRAHGVDIRTGVAVGGIVGSGGAAAGVRLADGSVLPADMVIVGIGIEPAVAPLLAAGAAGRQGVEVDAYCRTSLENIFAVGDCTLQQNRFTGGAMMRIESVQNANDQAMTVAKYFSGQKTPHEATPWFWSNQYDLRLQTVGLSVGYDEEILRGDPAARSFSVVYRCDGHVIALDCVNSARDYVQGKSLVQCGKLIDRTSLADASRSLKELAG
jgi:3-phenylpropionate/trans-cinnamate dioxygenase ferredoxin reductase subunit